MGQWEPLADHIPLDVRRLATQLRRMKDRSGLTVPALAARTGQSAETWSLALAGLRLPPLDAVEALAQASGADYDRTGALYALAERAQAGHGDRGRGKPVPDPDPLDPLGPQEGLPGHRRRLLMLAITGLLAAVALVGVMVTAGPSTGRAPARRDGGPVGSTDSGLSSGRASRTAMPGTAGPSGRSAGGTDGTPRDAASVAGSGTPGNDRGTDRPPAVPRPVPAAPRTGGASPGGPAAGGSGGSGASAGSAGGTAGGSGHGGTGGGGATTPPATSGGGSGPSGPTGPPTPTRSPLCLHVIVVGVCLG
jgi:transcriptional regulator with XRE-family HTH domain